MLELGLLYPEAALRGFGHHDIAFLLNGGYPDWAKPQYEPLELFAERLERECSDFQGDVLLSSEDFYLFPRPRELGRFVRDTHLDRGRDVKIILYLRRQDDLLISWYNQMVKAQGFAGSFDDALAISAWLGDFQSELARWAAVFGAENLIVRRYPSEQGKDSGLMTDFWSIVCSEIVPEAEGATDSRRNIALNRDLLEIQRIVNRLPLSIIEKRGFHQELMQLTSAGSPLFSEAPVADRAKRRELIGQFADANLAVAHDFFGCEELFPAPSEPEEEEERYAGLDLEKAIAALGWLLLRK